MNLVYLSEAKPRINKPSSLRPKFDNQYTEVDNCLYRVKSSNNVFIVTFHYESTVKYISGLLALGVALGGDRLFRIWVGYR